MTAIGSAVCDPVGDADYSYSEKHMPSALSFYVPPPRIDRDFDLGASLKRAQGLRQRGMVNDLAAMEMRDAERESSALGKYRMGLESDDPNAADALKGYPELQAQFFKAFQSMKPDEKKIAVKRTRAFATIAKNVDSETDPQRKIAVWNQGLSDLQQQGYISQDQAESQRDRPSDFMINEALTAEDWLDRALRESEAAGTTYESLSLKDKLAVDEAARKEAEVGVSQYETIPPEQMEERFLGARERVIQRMFPSRGAASPSISGKGDFGASIKDTERIGGAPTGAALPPEARGIAIPRSQPGTWKPGDQVPATHINAQRVTTREELEALPSGTPVILPDGRPTYRK